MRQKHAKKLINFRASDEIVFALEDLSEQLDISQTEVCCRAILLYHASPDGYVDRRPTGNRDVQVDTSQGSSFEQIKAAVPLIDPASLRTPVKEHWRDREKRLADENLTKRASEDKLARLVGRDDIEYDHEY